MGHGSSTGALRPARCRAKMFARYTVREIFSTHQKNDQVIVEYDTKVYYGLLRPTDTESYPG